MSRCITVFVLVDSRDTRCVYCRKQIFQIIYVMVMKKRPNRYIHSSVLCPSLYAYPNHKPRAHYSCIRLPVSLDCGTSLSGESAPIQHPAQPEGAADPSVAILAIPMTPATPEIPALTSPSLLPQCCASRLVSVPGEAGHPEVPRCGHFRQWVLRHRTSPSPGELRGRVYGSTRVRT